MRHWLQLATRNWRAKPGRTLAIIVAAALGVGTVVQITSIYWSVESALGEQLIEYWVGRSHITVTSPKAHWGSVQQSLADDIREIDGVKEVTVRAKTRMAIMLREGAPPLPQGLYERDAERVYVDVIGIVPDKEYDFRQLRDVTGRTIQAGDENVVVLDSDLLTDLHLSIGDTVDLEPYLNQKTYTAKVVGTFVARRVAAFQRPTVYLTLSDVQRYRGQPDKVSDIDVICTSAEPDHIEAVANKIRARLSERGEGHTVSTASSRITQLEAARTTSRLMLLVFAFIALLTSFFIILTTQSAGMIERVRQLGALRCVGVTRMQMAGLVFAEILPTGLLGVLLGWPIGIGLTYFAVNLVPHVDMFVPDVQVRPLWLLLAMLSGFGTVLVAGLFVVGMAARVSPLQAANPEAKPHRKSVVALAGVIGVLMLAVNYWMTISLTEFQWIKPAVAFLNTVTLYGGYVLIAPAIVTTVGALAVHLVAPLLGIRRKLAADQVSRAPWRAAGVCWMLMVGLSLIVYFAVRGESINRAWDFPTEMPGSFVWSYEPYSTDTLEPIKELPGVSAVTPIREVWCKVSPKRASLLSFLASQSVFVAGEPDSFFSMVDLEYVQGNAEDAVAKLHKGGYVLLPREASHSFGYDLGDKVPVTFGGKTVEFEVAGVVRSPAMDIAVTFFQADSYMMLAASSAVLGTLDDLRDKFGVDVITMVMLNVQVADTPIPEAFKTPEYPIKADNAWFATNIPEWLPGLPLEKEYMAPHVEPIVNAYTAEARRVLRREHSTELQRYRDAFQGLEREWRNQLPEQRWQYFQERLVLGRIRSIIHRPSAMTGSIRQLKQAIDHDVSKATLIISAIPAVCMLIATLGVANLMMVNVTSRARQIAMLRAVGTTKSQIARLVLVEALVLGVIGAIIGIAMGLHGSWVVGHLAERLFGLAIPFVVPWPRIIAGAILACFVCLLAGLGPALRAAKSNIIEAIQTS